jgi:hypothetical protein
VRFLFVVNRMAHVRHFDRAVRHLAGRGHEICLASQDDDVELRGVLADHPRVIAMTAPRNRTDDWAAHATMIRRARDYVRYLHPRYRDAVLLRNRAFEKLVRAVSGPDREIADTWSEMFLGVNKIEQKRLDAFFAKLETTIPPDPQIDAFVADQQPDAMVISPMVGIGFSQADFVKTARQFAIPSGMLVFSWDNLSNKGLIHDMPDRMFVWNKIQRREAERLHGYPADRVVITGAPRFDELFELRPATTREAFCGTIGADPSRPILVYLCSSKFVVPDERTFVERWIAELRRSSDPVLAGCTIVVRPHPGAMDCWHTAEASVVRWPGERSDKATVLRSFGYSRAVVLSSPMQNADQVLYDTVHHGAAVVGLNTSAEIEAGIIGRPVYTIIDPDAAGQHGTLHFRYLLQGQGGHVNLAEDFEQHRTQLSAALAGAYDRAAIERFVLRFVRPAGLDVPVAPLVADAIEGLLALRPGAVPAPALATRS